MMTRARVVGLGVVSAVGAIVLWLIIVYFLRLDFPYARGATGSAQGQIAFDVSPDGETIVFSAADGDLYSQNLKTRAVLRVTNTKEIEITPRFHPDGTGLVFARELPETDGSSIFASALDGKQVRQLTRDPNVFDSSPAYSADGSKIAFARAHRHRAYSLGGDTWDQWDLYVMNSDGTNLRRITRQEYYTLAAASFSIDGDTVIFSAVFTGERLISTIFEVDAGGRELPMVPPRDPPRPGRYAAWGSDPHLSPDGRRVTFISDRNYAYQYDIFVMDRDGSSGVPIDVTSTVSKYNQSPVFTPDGKGILFLTARKWASGNRPVLSLWQVDTDGNNPRCVATSDLLRTGTTDAASNDAAPDR